jgi:hypothetical protein
MMMVGTMLGIGCAGTCDRKGGNGSEGDLLHGALSVRWRANMESVPPAFNLNPGKVFNLTEV